MAGITIAIPQVICIGKVMMTDFTLMKNISTIMDMITMSTTTGNGRAEIIIIINPGEEINGETK